MFYFSGVEHRRLLKFWSDVSSRHIPDQLRTFSELNTVNTTCDSIGGHVGARKG